MKVLVVGSGGREHAIANALSASPRVDTVLVAPGNGGIEPACRRAVAVTDVDGIVALAAREAVDLVVIGPEAALAAGVADGLRAAGIACFGASAAAAQLESSKAFARRLADRLGIASPVSAAFTDAAAATQWAERFARPVVVKANGLAAGKGVIVPEGWEATVAAIHALVAEHGEIVVEERLSGPEVSLLGFTDGHAVVAMPPAQDHKRVGEGDTGPNTGGMGAFAPVPEAILPAAQLPALVEEFLARPVQAMAQAGTPFVGVLYAGLMLTADGPRLIEWNARFGDPEAQVLLALLDTPLVDVIEACVHGRLEQLKVAWSPSTACCVVVAAPGYPAAPEVGGPILVQPGGDGHALLHAGTERTADGSLVASGGRVLNAIGVGADLAGARAAAYAVAEGVSLSGSQIRRDIGWRAIAASSGGYAASGVDIDAGTSAVDQMKAAVERTHGSAVLRGIGAFGGAIDASAFADRAEPVLVASTDGCGTKVMVAIAAGRPEVLGADIVNHCINDVLVQRAYPLFFLDYVASSRLDPGLVARLVSAMAGACEAAGCALLGGETAEMPGVYAEGHLDVVGTLVGVAERSRLLPRSDVGPGDVLVGLGSSGPHTNGYSLLRRVFAGLPLDASPAPLTGTLADALCQPHRSYLGPLKDVLDGDLVKALVHITGGGLVDNLPRVLPSGCGARIQLGSWPVPPLFELTSEVSGLDAEELHRTLNMGIGMVVVCAAAEAPAVQAAIAEPTWVIGNLVESATSAVELVRP